MSEVFQKYAKYYELLYKDKDYKRECDFLEGIFQSFGAKRITNILEIGCGTGGHAIPLAKRGYKITGIDPSSTMLQIAKRKSKGENVTLSLHQADVRNFNLRTRFDAALAMFAVISYLPTNNDLKLSFANVRRHLGKDSLFVFDVWNGLAVLRILPEVRIKIIEDKERRILRIAQPELDAFNHLCRVHYHLLILQNNTVINEVEETHIIRYLFPQEIIHYLEDAGFEVLKICPFLDLEGKVDENEWNITVIGKAI